jgi:Glycerophosphoryl diester phosphodiesterase family
MNRNLLAGLGVTFVLLTGPKSNAAALRGCVADFPTETTAARQARHQKIAEHRAGPIILVHRGASAFAPENTLEAYAAAMDYGADGCEVDIRRTTDGILVLFHDDMLDRTTDGFGKVEQLSYYELLSLQPRYVYGTAKRPVPPTFAALLTLARQRAMLLHLDIKEPGLESDIAQFLEAADVWDHIVALNTENGPHLLKHPNVKLLAYKKGLYEKRLDVDPRAVKEALTRPGQMVIVDDPRVTAQELKRPSYLPVPLPKGLFTDWSPAVAATPAHSTNLVPAEYLRSVARRIDPNSVSDLTALLSTNGFPAGSEPDGSLEYQQHRTERILERAWAAQRLGQIWPRSSAPLIELLEFQVRHRSLHRDWLYHGLDGAMAARALGRIGVVESAPLLIATFRHVDPDLKKVANPKLGPYPLGWTDWRKMYLLDALGELRGPESKRFLLEYLGMEETAARELASPSFEEATKALLRHPLSSGELVALLRSPHSEVRGRAILEYIDHPTRERTAALRDEAPWALALPKARP